MDVYFCDDDPEVLEAYTMSFEIEGLKVRAFSSAHQLIAVLEPGARCVVLSDMRMPGMDGFELLRQACRIDQEIPVLFLTGHGDVPMAVQALRQGAWDFIEKPADPVVLVETLARAMDNRRVVLENRYLRSVLTDPNSVSGRILGNSPPTQYLRQTLMRLANTSVDVLLLGETGTGKEVAARILHDFGIGRQAPFVAINCGALAESVIESELFGHEAGSFTGADKLRIGKIEQANGGTLFLDEVESMSLAAQVRLLRVLQERTLVRLGSNKEIPLKLRIVTAAKDDLIALGRTGRFRQDLAYRLDIARVELPPLRERGDDVLVIFEHFLSLAAQREGHAPPPISPSLRAALLEHDWPGNIREVRNRAERLLLGMDERQPAPQAQPSDADTLKEQLDRAERAAIEEALRVHRNHLGRVADTLGVSRKTLYLKMRKLGRKFVSDSD
ncbi:MAG: Fis family transcriptional regulator [Devosia sp.]|nr:Fis family transcriptional regulator [Devosia sp.]